MAPDSCDLYLKKSTPAPPSPAPPPPPAPISFWPLPISVSFGGSVLAVSPALAISVSPASANVSAYAAHIASEIFMHAGATPGGAMAALNIKIANVAAPLVLGVDESYTLTLPADGSAGTLTANTIYGAMMGLQTFSQAVRFNFDSGAYEVAAAPLAITDAPKFAWRGILIDTDRHWLSLRHIYRIIDSLAMAKMNVLHWHIVDWQSWPLASASYPKLWSAAWSKGERYTLADVVAVTRYANDRGIRVVNEFDTPGHATSMCVGYPELCCSAACGPAGNAPLSPVPVGGKNVSLDAIQAVLSELASVTTDEFFHLGGDEVAQDCWQNTPAVQAWMAAQNPPITTTDGVYEYFVQAVDTMALSLNKSPIRWEESVVIAYGC